MDSKTTPAPKRRRFSLIMVVALLIVFGVAVAILEYGTVTTVSLDITGSPHAYFVVAHGSTNVTLPEDQNSDVQIPQHTNITVYAFPDSSYQVASWNVSPVSITPVGPDSIQLLTGADGSTIRLSVTLNNGSNP